MNNTASRMAELLLRQDPPRDPLTGRLLKDLTPRQLASVLEQYPCLRAVAPELPDPNAIPKWDLSWSPLLRDPAPVRHEPTKPDVRSSERTVAVAYHEAFHAAAALHNGIRVLSATIVRAGHTDGKVTMLLDRKDCPVLNAYVSLAGEVSDVASGYPMSPESYSGDRDIGGTLEWREAIRDIVRSELHLFTGGAMEIARKLIAKKTLSEFEVKSAYITGQRRAREEAARNNGGGSATRQVVRRHLDFSKAADLAYWRSRQLNPNAQPYFTRMGTIKTESFK